MVALLASGVSKTWRVELDDDGDVQCHGPSIYFSFMLAGEPAPLKELSATADDACRFFRRELPSVWLGKLSSHPSSKVEMLWDAEFPETRAFIVIANRVRVTLSGDSLDGDLWDLRDCWRQISEELREGENNVTGEDG